MVSKDVSKPQSELKVARAAAVSILVIMAAILLMDRPISTYSHDVLQRPAWCVWVTWIAELPQPAAVLTLFGCGGAWLLGWRPGLWGRVLLAACLATLVADAAKDVLKPVFGRPWPETWIDKNPSWIATKTFGFFPFHGGLRGAPAYASFPSGHLTAITAPCQVLWRYARRFRPLLVFLPVLVTIGIIGADYHFLSDCLAGALLGVACAKGVESLVIRMPAADRKKVSESDRQLRSLKPAIVDGIG